MSTKPRKYLKGGPFHQDGHCTRCGNPVDQETWLELDLTTGEYAEPGAVPEDRSQGVFLFGPDCAAALLRRNRR